MLAGDFPTQPTAVCAYAALWDEGADRPLKAKASFYNAQVPPLILIKTMSQLRESNGAIGDCGYYSGLRFWRSVTALSTYSSVSARIEVKTPATNRLPPELVISRLII